MAPKASFAGDFQDDAHTTLVQNGHKPVHTVSGKPVYQRPTVRRRPAETLVGLGAILQVVLGRWACTNQYTHPNFIAEELPRRRQTRGTEPPKKRKCSLEKSPLLLLLDAMGDIINKRTIGSTIY
jgi:hypothetical protein